MSLKTFLLIVFHISIVRTSDYYTGAVVEYRLRDFVPNAEQNVIQNALMHRRIIRNLVINNKVQPDIIVFPENGLNDFSTDNPVSTVVPSVAENVTPCQGDSRYTYDTKNLLVSLSCTAQMYNVYMVVNLLEKYDDNGKINYYNTNVAFNRNGTIVARYRKHNLYSRQSTLTTPASPEFSYFDTDFGVRFGLFTCFDIVFKTPALDLVNIYNITHFVFPTHWFSEMPFLTAIQAQHSWAAGNNVVLLASGLNNPQTGSTGTGIYIGADFGHSYAQTDAPSEFVIYRKIPKHIVHHEINDLGSLMYFVEGTPELDLFMKKDKDIYSSESEMLNENSTVCDGSPTCNSSQSADLKTICKGDFCCDFSFNFTSFYEEERPNHERYLQSGDDFGFNYYRLVVFNGVKDYYVAEGYLQICAVLSCNDEHIGSCGIPTYKIKKLSRHFNGRKYIKSRSTFFNLKISANFSDRATSIMPNVLGQNSNRRFFGSLGEVNSYSFNKNHFPKEKIMQAVIETDQTYSPYSIENLGVFGIYTRVFDKTKVSTDNPNESDGMFNFNIAFFLFSIIVTFILFLTYLLWLYFLIDD